MMVTIVCSLNVYSRAINTSKWQFLQTSNLLNHFLRRGGKHFSPVEMCDCNLFYICIIDRNLVRFSNYLHSFLLLTDAFSVFL